MHNNRPNTIREALQRASSFLSDAGITEHMFIAEYLIRSYLNWDRTRFVLELQSDLSQEDWLGISHWLNRASAGEPVQYIVGKQEFYGETFHVAPGVLIPRPETELLIDHVLRLGDTLWGTTETNVRVIDLGTGSGAIPITIAKQRPHWDVWALDLSDQALTIAKANAERLGVSDRIRFLHGSMLDLGEVLQNHSIIQFDIIVSNPPYIPRADIPHLQREVKDHEPMMALDGGEDGLDFYRSIAAQARDVLKSPGLVAFEIGIGQGEDVAELLKQAGVKHTEIHLDFQGIDRIVLGVFSYIQ